MARHYAFRSCRKRSHGPLRSIGNAPETLEHSVLVQRLVPAQGRAYGEPSPTGHDAAMTRSKHRYRISVTPIETDGHQCIGRCSIEFEQHSHHSWMREFESAQRLRRLSCNDDASLVVVTGLLIALAEASVRADSPLATLQPELDQLLHKLDALRSKE